MNEDDFKKHIKPSRELILTHEGKETKFILKPLAWEYMPNFFSLTEKFTNVLAKKNVDIDKLASSIEKGEKMENMGDILELMDKEMMTNLSFLALETIKTSYPDLSEETAKEFVRDNLFDLMMPIIDLNTPNIKDEPKKQTGQINSEEERN